MVVEILKKFESYDNGMHYSGVHHCVDDTDISAGSNTDPCCNNTQFQCINCPNIVQMSLCDTKLSMTANGANTSNICQPDKWPPRYARCTCLTNTSPVTTRTNKRK